MTASRDSQTSAEIDGHEVLQHFNGSIKDWCSRYYRHIQLQVFMHLL